MKIVCLAVLFFLLSPGVQSQLEIKIKEMTKHMVCAQPDEMNPVTLSAKSVSEGDSIGIIVKVAMAPGWHIYAYVPPTLPYIAIDQILRLPENVRAVGQWKKTEPSSSSDEPGVLMYENEAVFVHKAVRLPHSKTNGIIRAGLYYQTCNLRQCLPPDEKIFELRY